MTCAVLLARLPPPSPALPPLAVSTLAPGFVVAGEKGVWGPPPGCTMKMVGRGRDDVASTVSGPLKAALLRTARGGSPEDGCGAGPKPGWPAAETGTSDDVSDAEWGSEAGIGAVGSDCESDVGVPENSAGPLPAAEAGCCELVAWVGVARGWASPGVEAGGPNGRSLIAATWHARNALL